MVPYFVVLLLLFGKYANILMYFFNIKKFEMNRRLNLRRCRKKGPQKDQRSPRCETLEKGPGPGLQNTK